jgi:hypothetical protein
MMSTINRVTYIIGCPYRRLWFRVLYNRLTRGRYLWGIVGMVRDSIMLSGRWYYDQRL